MLWSTVFKVLQAKKEYMVFQCKEGCVLERQGKGFFWLELCDIVPQNMLANSTSIS